MRAIFLALPALALLAIMPALPGAEAQVQTLHNITVSFGTSGGRTINPDTGFLYQSERFANQNIECTIQYPVYESVLVPNRDFAGQFVGGLTSFSTLPSSHPKCHTLGITYWGDHSALPVNSTILGATLKLHIASSVNPKTCQILMTEFPSRPRTDAEFETLWNTHVDILALRNDIVATLEANTYIPERHVAFDNNFCLAASGTTHIIDFPAATFPLLLKIFENVHDYPAPISQVPGSNDDTLVLSIAQNNATTDDISYTRVHIDELQIRLSLPTITDTRPGNSPVEYLTLRSQDMGDQSVAGDCNGSRYQTFTTARSITKNYDPTGTGNNSFCSFMVMVMDLNYPRGIDFHTLGVNYGLGVTSVNPEPCDVYVSPIPADPLDYHRLWEIWNVKPSNSTTFPNIILVEDSTNCYTPLQADNFSDFAIGNVETVIANIQQGRVAGFLGPVEYDHDKFAIVIMPSNSTWGVNDPGHNIEYQSSVFFAGTHDGIYPMPITQFNISSTNPSSVVLTWQAPPSAPLAYTAYEIREVLAGGATRLIDHLPFGMNSLTITGLVPNKVYTYQVSAVTQIGTTVYPQTATASSRTATNIQPGTLLPFSQLPPSATGALGNFIIKRNDFPTYSLVTLDYLNTIDPACRYEAKFGRTGGNITLTPNPVDDRLVDTITVNGTQNDFVTIYCTDPANGIDIRYPIPQQDNEFNRQLRNFQSGTYGTFGQFGVFDLIGFAAILLSFIGFNRINPIVGIVTSISMLAFLAWMNVIQFETSIITLIGLLVLLTIVSARRIGSP